MTTSTHAVHRSNSAPFGEHLGVVMPLMLRTPGGVLSFFSTLTVFGSPNDVTLQELAVESFFPVDDFTARALRAGTVR